MFTYVFNVIGQYEWRHAGEGEHYLRLPSFKCLCPPLWGKCVRKFGTLCASVARPFRGRGARSGAAPCRSCLWSHGCSYTFCVEKWTAHSQSPLLGSVVHQNITWCTGLKSYGQATVASPGLQQRWDTGRHPEIDPGWPVQLVFRWTLPSGHRADSSVSDCLVGSHHETSELRFLQRSSTVSSVLDDRSGRTDAQRQRFT